MIQKKFVSYLNVSRVLASPGGRFQSLDQGSALTSKCGDFPGNPSPGARGDDPRTNDTGFHPQHCLVIPHPTQNNTNRDRRHNARERDLSAMH